MLTAATTALGPVSVLVNAASGFPADTLADVTVEELRRTLDLTLLAPVAATQAFAAMLPEGMGGAVVNITDAKLDTPYLRHFGYMVAKGGLDAFTRAAAVALAPRIRVNAVAPGVVLPPSGADDDYVTLISRNVVLPSPGGAETVAAAVCALILNDFVTGETIRVDGGAHLT